MFNLGLTYGVSRIIIMQGVFMCLNKLIDMPIPKYIAIQTKGFIFGRQNVIGLSDLSEVIELFNNTSIIDLKFKILRVSTGEMYSINMCFHKWSKWSKIKSFIDKTYKHYSGDVVLEHGYHQTRACLKCGKVQRRAI
jgi:hypothetical protein